ncbi:hypothetical protein Asi02nite_49210 [Asanoa siamensis]|uniref:Uncharacterized protein n=1 Tax=Asanoa siamensis TaxID=926357 RepID=A0ABQ4CVS9_9ACTN|nr:hypothetical protein Asi02nite_49210 [Asanoa siamensis]
MLLQHDDLDTRAREQQAQHDAGGPAADDTDGGLDEAPPARRTHGRTAAAVKARDVDFGVARATP